MNPQLKCLFLIVLFALSGTSQALPLNWYVNDKRQLLVNSTENLTEQIRIMNISGISVLSKPVQLSAGMPVEMDCSQFSKGVYIVARN